MEEAPAKPPSTTTARTRRSKIGPRQKRTNKSGRPTGATPATKRKRTPGFGDYHKELVDAWLTRNYRMEQDSKVPKNQVFKEYEAWGKAHGLHLMSPNIFGKFVFDTFEGMKSCRPGKIGRQTPHYLHLTKVSGGSSGCGIRSDTGGSPPISFSCKDEGAAEGFATPTNPSASSCPSASATQPPSLFSSFHISWKSPPPPPPPPHPQQQQPPPPPPPSAYTPTYPSSSHPPPPPSMNLAPLRDDPCGREIPRGIPSEPSPVSGGSKRRRIPTDPNPSGHCVLNNKNNNKKKTRKISTTTTTTTTTVMVNHEEEEAAGHHPSMGMSMPAEEGLVAEKQEMIRPVGSDHGGDEQGIIMPIYDQEYYPPAAHHDAGGQQHLNSCEVPSTVHNQWWDLMKAHKQRLRAMLAAGRDLDPLYPRPTPEQSGQIPLVDAIEQYGEFLRLGLAESARQQFLLCLKALQCESELCSSPGQLWALVVGSYILAGTADFWCEGHQEDVLLNVVRDRHSYTHEYAFEAFCESVAWYGRLCGWV